MPVTIDKVLRISEMQANRLHQLAIERATTEDELIAKALMLLFTQDLSEDESTEPTAWSTLSLQSFSRIWDNDSDAIYDNWKELYAV